MGTSVIDKHFFFIDYIRRSGVASRNQICKALGMNAATVGNIIEKLLDEGIIKEDAFDAGKSLVGAGRPPIPLRLNPGTAYFIGINFSGESLCATLADFAGAPVKTLNRDFPQPVSKDVVLRTINKVLQELIDTCEVNGERIQGIGIGAPGTVDSKTGFGVAYNRIRRWENVSLADAVGATTSLPVFVAHNSDCFALGEVNLGEARRFANIVSIVIRTGIAMGVVCNREIFSMSSRSAGELGHITINPKGGKCWCGNRGCLETYISGWLLRKKLKAALKKGDVSAVFHPRELSRMASEGDDFAISVLGGMFEHLGLGISYIVRLMRPEVIVINGHFNPAGELMRERIAKSMRLRAIPECDVPEIIVSSDDDTIGACGAALMAISRMYNPYHYHPIAFLF
ncbi:MAG: ROK family transcriptional regulator [Victivallales bacterium]|nr:ROK family transcriptional regulator [Victivallales bacterium]